MERATRLVDSGDLKGAERELREAVELSPGESRYWAHLGIVLATEQRLEESVTCFDKALALDPGNFEVRRNRALREWQLGRLTAADEDLGMILRSKPDDPHALLLRGMVAEALKDYPRAVALLSPLRSLVQERAESTVALGHAYYAVGEKAKAQELLSTLLRHTDDPEGVFLGGQVAADAEDYPTAETLFLSIRRTYSDPIRVGYNLALSQYHDNRSEECQGTLLELVHGGAANADIYSLLGSCYQGQSKYEESVAAFTQAVQFDPKRETSYVDFGRALIRFRRYAAAAALAAKASDALPTSSKIFEVKGMAEILMQDYARAEKSYARALELNPQSAEANLGLAESQFAGGKPREALATFEQGLKQFPQHALHYQEYGRALLKTAESGDATAEERARAVLSQAIVLDSSLPEPHYLLGNLALRKGQAEEARQQLAQACKLASSDGKYHFALSRAYRRLGREDDASREAEIFRKLKDRDE